MKTLKLKLRKKPKNKPNLQSSKKKKRRRKLLLFKNIWPRKRRLTSERKQEKSKKSRKPVLKELKRMFKKLKVNLTNSRIERCIQFLSLTTQKFLDSKLVMMITTSQMVKEEAEVVAVAEVAVAPEAAEVVLKETDNQEEAKI
jgi:hypothetical protein